MTRTNYKPVPNMTYNVFVAMLNVAQSINVQYRQQQFASFSKQLLCFFVTSNG